MARRSLLALGSSRPVRMFIHSSPKPKHTTIKWHKRTGVAECIRHAVSIAQPTALGSRPLFAASANSEFVAGLYQLPQLVFFRAAGNDLISFCDAVLERGSQPGHINCRAGVQLHDVARRADFVVQHTQ